MRIAFTTSDNVHINAHFGWAKKIDVYEVSTEGYQFLKTLKFDGDLKEDGNEDKLLPKIEALYDCTIVYVSAIGGSAAARLIKKRITPVKAQSEEQEITDVLTKLVATLNGNPPPWLRKVLQQQQQSTFLDRLEEEATPV
ncbi:MAG TPA: nitrogen fixation protein NifX [Cyanobacteria bacterium UBA11149]|nr:nitrogen fixation protein NifX [Cyanobacteria bacterium UBA11367]HBE58648.1 nitrogen fixation protein NifX [Cyanobacteria bacterium UBA11366]HBK66699.1 nitrogen fixation protein NifX [Cyanobacteria bacterium UBA11166]HBR73956.1 nitrogen fixation protein NifX [Cyanobacteria bacterium UBA11159]HBS69612.1 nitrogen fixation protein NifX [Cyanobacteria bacterium UBA11153]HBW88501.1 nitrogen fixation protein NifX [Cyanobacteria bacterium UBA11149]HCA96407.1 nitrogen fixation protein NifX [Cyanob